MNYSLNNKNGDKMQDLLIHSGRAIVFYIYLALIVRFLGKREVGEIGIFDLAVLLLISNIASISIENLDIPSWYFIIVILVIALIQKLISFIQLKIPFLRKVFDGKMSVIIYNGKLNTKEMKKNLYNIEDLLLQLRSAGVVSIKDVRIAILEHTGNLNVYLNSDTKMIPLPVIVSGNVVKDNLFYLNITENEVFEMLLKKKVNIKDVNCAFLDNNDLFIVKKYCDSPLKKNVSK